MVKRIGLLVTLVGSAAAQQNRISPPRIWDDKALAEWATPIAALGVRPRHFTAAEYYAAPLDNLRTYPVYRPDREPPGYWEWLRKQKPLPLVDASKLRTREDWMKAGESAFRALDEVWRRTSDPDRILSARDVKAYEGVWTYPDGTLPRLRWVVTPEGVQLTLSACAVCHSLGRPDGNVFWGAPGTGIPPTALRDPSGRGLGMIRSLAVPALLTSPAFLFQGDSPQLESWRSYTVPWAPDPRIERLRGGSEAEDRELRRSAGAPAIGVIGRIHGSPYYPAKTPDLTGLRYSRYIDATGTHRLRGPEDVARYAAFVSGADPMEFGEYRILKPEQRRVPFRYADEVLYAIGVYLMALDAPRNPNPAPAAVIERGCQVFTRETCVNCHVPPNFTNAKLTLAEGYTPPADHPYHPDIVNVSVGTDPGLATKTRKGTGFYKIPSLRGVWYRPLLLHDGSVANLEEMFDPNRLRPDHEPGGWKGPGVTNRAIAGHPFGLGLNPEDKDALLAFLRSL